jgi:TPR repeat protein
MRSIWKFFCFPLLICLALAPSFAATPASPSVKAGPIAKPAKKAKKPAPQPKPAAKAKPRTAKSTAATSEPKAKATAPVAPEKSGSPVDQVAPEGGNLDADIAAMRQVLTDQPGDTRARERLARLTVTIVDELLAAEAVGNAGRVDQLTRRLTSDLADTGWRVQKIAQGGDLMARQATGFLLGRGVLLEKDADKSCAEYLVAAEKFAASGWHAAQCQMKLAPDRAWMQMERAAGRGHAAAQEWMGRRCLGEFGATAIDHACARTWLGQSASQGRSRSQTMLAYLMMNGLGGAVDEPRAARLYRLAADQGDADAQNNLGEITEMGRGAAANPEEALRWYLKAAEQGLAAAQFNAGRLMAIGAADKKKDQARARALLLQAEGSGITQAREVLNWLDRQSAPAAPEPAAPTSVTVLPGELKSK